MDLVHFIQQFTPRPVVASGIEIGLLAVGLALSAAAGLLLKPPKSGARTPAAAPVLAARGSFIPRLMGTRRIGAVFAWAGQPKSATSSTGGIFGFGSVKTKITNQAGLHLLCVGPARRLTRIWQDGKIIYPAGGKTTNKGEQPLDSSTTLSGSTIHMNSPLGGTFRIYWGEAGGPIDPLVANTLNGMGINTRFPNVCYIVWNNKILAAPNQWPTLNYEVECRPQISSTYVSGNSWFDGIPLASYNGIFIPASALTPFRQQNGADPIHAIAELMVNTYPHGVGIPPANIDFSFFNGMQAILAAEGSVPIVSNVLCETGNSAASTINAILQDIGGIIPQIGDKIIVLLIRKETSVPTITNDALLPPLAEKVFVQGALPFNRTTYIYKDRTYAFNDNDVTIDSDSETPGQINNIQVSLDSIVDLTIANIILDRKQMENLVAVRTFTVTAGRQVRALSPGQVFFNADLGQLRITSVARPDLSSSVVLECVQDTYSPDPQSIANQAVREGGTIDVTNGTWIYPDAALFMWVVPYDLMPIGAELSDTWIQFFPIRSTPYVIENDVFTTFDTNPTPIYALTQQKQALFVLGVLTTPILPFIYWDVVLPISSDTYQLEINLFNRSIVGPTGLAETALLDFDVTAFPDLTAYPDRWRSGENCCAIEDQAGIFREVIYFKSITVSPNANCYYLNGILRNRMIKTSDPVGQYSGRVVLFRKQDIDPAQFPNSATGALWSLNKTIIAKTNVIGANGDVQLDEGNAKVSKAVTLSFSPIPPANFRSIDGDTGNNRYSYASGASCTFKWSNRPLLVGAGNDAGRQLAGVAVSGSATPFEGVLIINIWPTFNDFLHGTNLKRTFSVSSGITQAYTNGQMTTDSTITTFYASYQVNYNGILGPVFGATFNAR